MKTKILTGLAMAAVLLIGQPVFAYSHRGGGRPAAAVHRAAPHFAAARVHRGPVRSFVVSRGHAVRGAAFARNTNHSTTSFARTNNVSRHSVAFGGGGANYNNGSHGRYAFASHNGWSHNQAYFWHGHHYRWYGNGWFIIDPFPYGYGYYGPNNGYYYGAGAPVSIDVQQALQQQGYYHGPVDGVIGPGTSAAIAAYQHDNGLRVTGTITPGLLANLGIG